MAGGGRGWSPGSAVVRTLGPLSGSVLLFTEVQFLPERTKATKSSLSRPAPLLWGVWGHQGAGGLGSEFVTAFQRCHH